VDPEVLLVQMASENFEAVRSIKPDLRIEHFEIETLADVSAAVERVAKIAGRADLGAAASKEFEAKLDVVRVRTAGLARPRVLFVLGYENPSSPGKGTFIDDMIGIAGGTNVLAADRSGWLNPGLETIVRLAPEIIICQCKPSRKEETLAYWNTLGNPERWPRRVVAVTDPDWTFPAAHLADYAAEMAVMIHPELLGGEASR
jgi:iron complex transport system substrate-binding protein